jgi:hypothetical protein
MTRDGAIVPAELPENVRQVPAPAVRWQITIGGGLTYDGYVFEDDPSDLAKFFRWLAEPPYGGYGTHQLSVLPVPR